jgi:hypothetical protein
MAYLPVLKDEAPGSSKLPIPLYLSITLQIIILIRCGILRAVNIKITVFWDVTLCSSVDEPAASVFRIKPTSSTLKMEEPDSSVTTWHYIPQSHNVNIHGHEKCKSHLQQMYLIVYASMV